MPTSIAGYPVAEFHELLRRGAVLFRLGPLILRLEAADSAFAAAFGRLYGEEILLPADAHVADILLQLRPSGRGHQQWFINGSPSEYTPFVPELTLAHLEWVIHFAVSAALAPSLACHAAVAADDEGRAVALVGASGSGKSTLVAGLVAAGWRLVADEFLILSPDGRVLPMPGVITLKGNALELIRSRAPHFHFGPVATYPGRGVVGHVAAPARVGPGDAVRLMAMVLPTYEEGQPTSVAPVLPADVLHALIEQSQNRHVLGSSGFHSLCTLARLPTTALRYSDLDDGITAVAGVLSAASR